MSNITISLCMLLAAMVQQNAFCMEKRITAIKVGVQQTTNSTSPIQPGKYCFYTNIPTQHPVLLPKHSNHTTVMGTTSVKQSWHSAE